MNFMIVNKEELFMFNLDEYMLHQVLAIVGIVFLIFFIVGYIITAIFSKIMFDILGVRSGLAFIPFYNTYRIYKEYKGRVWKRNWGVAYIITFVLPMAVIGGFVFTLINLPIITGDRFYDYYALTLFLGLVVLVVGGLIISVFNFILLFTMYLPIFDTKGRRVVLYIQAALTLLVVLGNSVILKIDPHFDSLLLVKIQMIFSVVFTIVYLLSAREVRARIRSGEYVLQEKLDYGTMDNFELNATLKARERKLVVPRISKTTNYYVMDDNVIQNNYIK